MKHVYIIKYLFYFRTPGNATGWKQNDSLQPITVITTPCSDYGLQISGKKSIYSWKSKKCCGRQKATIFWNAKASRFNTLLFFVLSKTYIVDYYRWSEKYFGYIHDEAKKNICVFTVTRPTLIFASDPINLYTEFR